ncbi:free fatty acid receptor 4-like [Asterias rubens]|uniref:free fatty acid receptor 4-like n=1 Tax=Asterias rubens TaxID=7604 RepID=UPI0014554D51|nr:free fatty acid receptor 4-like [Asterias rubens]
MGLMAMVSISGNVLVISFFVRFKAIRQVTNLFITNLALSDLIFTLMVPLVMVTRVTGVWVFGEVLCRLLTAVEFVCGIVSVWTMVLISVDRYQAIVSLQRHRSTLNMTLLRLLLVWIGAAIFVLPLVLYFRTTDSTIEDNHTGLRRNVTVCTFDFPGPLYLPLIYSCINIVVVFIIPMSIITRNYRAIMRKFSMSLQRMREHMVAAPRTDRSSAKASTNVQREARVMRMLITMVTVFVLMWGPVTMTIIALMADYDRNGMESYQITAVFIVTYANAAVNPVVYGILNAQYRKRFARLFCKSQCQEVTASNSSVGGGGGSIHQQVIRTLSGKVRNRTSFENGNACHENPMNNICEAETPS